MPLMLCVWILYISGGTYSFKVDSKRKIFWESFHGSCIYIEASDTVLSPSYTPLYVYMYICTYVCKFQSPLEDV